MPSRAPKIKAETVWAAIDQIAKDQGLSPSGLARACGLDNTAFNPSKRKAPSGAARWPSLDTVLLICEVRGITLHGFANYLKEGADA